MSSTAPIGVTNAHFAFYTRHSCDISAPLLPCSVAKPRAAHVVLRATNLVGGRLQVAHVRLEILFLLGRERGWLVVSGGDVDCGTLVVSGPTMWTVRPWV